MPCVGMKTEDSTDLRDPSRGGVCQQFSRGGGIGGGTIGSVLGKVRSESTPFAGTGNRPGTAETSSLKRVRLCEIQVASLSNIATHHRRNPTLITNIHGHGEI